MFVSAVAFLAKYGGGGTAPVNKFIDATVKHMDTFAKEGLRTLVIAQAELDPEAYEQWADQYEEVGGYVIVCHDCRIVTKIPNQYLGCLLQASFNMPRVVPPFRRLPTSRTVDRCNR